MQTHSPSSASGPIGMNIPTTLLASFGAEGRIRSRRRSPISCICVSGGTDDSYVRAHNIHHSEDGGGF